MHNAVCPDNFAFMLLIIGGQCEVPPYPLLGHIRLGKLGPEHVQKAWNDMLMKGKLPGLVEHCHMRLSMALNDAMRRQFIYRNPCQAVSPPKAGTKELHPPDAAAIHSLLEAARYTGYSEIVHTAFYTGLRREELLALKWGDVDLDMSTLSVNRSLYRAKGGQSIYQDPKTAKGRRLVALTPSSVLLLKALWERQEVDGLLQGYTVNGESPVFRMDTGSMTPGTHPQR